MEQFEKLSDFASFLSEPEEKILNNFFNSKLDMLEIIKTSHTETILKKFEAELQKHWDKIYVEKLCTGNNHKRSIVFANQATHILMLRNYPYDYKRHLTIKTGLIVQLYI